jgi:hypothetical protein
VQDSSGKTHLSLRVTAIVAQPTPDAPPVAMLPDEITLRSDKETLTVKDPRRYSSFGASREDFIVDDEKFIEKIRSSREVWLVAYTTIGEKNRNDMLIPDAWKQAVTLLLDKRKTLLPVTPQY